MPRYFIEVCYKGTSFSGFQVQDNAITVQGEINHALSVLLKEKIESTTSSRTDAGVHAIQNFLHFDTSHIIAPKSIYNLNAILHKHIQVRNLYLVDEKSHARFDATSREYTYHLVHDKNPFEQAVTYFYPMSLDIELLNQASQLLLNTTDFSAFAKRHSDVNNFNCKLNKASWILNQHNQIVFTVKSNRFLRGMVRALVGTQLLVGRKKISLDEFQAIILSHDCTQADFSAPAHGLFLQRVDYPDEILSRPLVKTI